MIYIKTEKGLEKLSTKEFKNKQERLISQNYKSLRQEEYGSVSKQIEFISENGLDAWTQRMKDIKVKHPKPKKLIATS